MGRGVEGKKSSRMVGVRITPRTRGRRGRKHVSQENLCSQETRKGRNVPTSKM